MDRDLARLLGMNYEGSKAHNGVDIDVSSGFDLVVLRTGTIKDCLQVVA